MTGAVEILAVCSSRAKAISTTFKHFEPSDRFGFDPFQRLSFIGKAVDPACFAVRKREEHIPARSDLHLNRLKRHSGLRLGHDERSRGAPDSHSATGCRLGSGFCPPSPDKRRARSRRKFGLFDKVLRTFRFFRRLVQSSHSHMVHIRTFNAKESAGVTALEFAVAALAFLFVMFERSPPWLRLYTLWQRRSF
jgi:hypothetical protein